MNSYSLVRASGCCPFVRRDVVLRPYLNQAAFSIGVREWIGLLAYRLSGKSDDLLPRP